MRNYTPVQYKNAVVIVHGKSERFLASYIYTNLHLPVKIIGVFLVESCQIHN